MLRYLGRHQKYSRWRTLNRPHSIVTRAIFVTQNSAVLHILLRDYARAIIEYAFRGVTAYRRKLISDNADLHTRAIGLLRYDEEELKILAEEAGGKPNILVSDGQRFRSLRNHSQYRHFTRVPLTQDRPLNEEEKREAFRQAHRRLGF